MTHLVFHPWKGSKFDNAHNGRRLLLIGESHYGEPSEDPALATSTVVEKWRSGEWSVRYLTAAARVLTDKQCWEIDRKADLSAIAFYNFVQVNMPFCGRRPTAEDGLASQPAFREVLERLAPTHLVATGTFVWEHLPEFDGRRSLFQVGDSQHEIGEYHTSHGVVLATMIPHLSRYFSPPQWTPVVRLFMSLECLPTA